MVGEYIVALDKENSNNGWVVYIDSINKEGVIEGPCIEFHGDVVIDAYVNNTRWGKPNTEFYDISPANSLEIKWLENAISGGSRERPTIEEVFNLKQ